VLQQQCGTQYTALGNVCQSVDVIHAKGLKGRGEEGSNAVLRRQLTHRWLPKNHLLWYNLGITYRDAGELQKAKDSLLTAFKLSPENESIIETLAHICFLLSEYTEALSFCEEGLSVNPINHHLWNNSGVIYFATDDYEKACEAFEKAVTIDPNYYDALYNLRDTYIQLGNDIGAKECARRLKTMSVGDFYAQ